MAGEIINNIAEILFWDIFLMGIFTLLILSAGAIWAFSSIKGFLSKADSFIKWASNMNLNHAIASTIVALVAIYCSGIIVNTFSDSWIDEYGLYHLSLKPSWFESDDSIKIHTFRFIYKDNKDKLEPDIINHYYRAKNELWKDPIWREYILYSQTMINISRVWCFSFFLLFIFAILRLPILLIIWRREKKSSKVRKLKEEPKEMVISLLIVAVALIGYLVGGRAWLSNEKEIDNKIFGAYRFIEKSKALGEFKSKKAVEPLIKIILDRNEDSDVRKAAAYALGEINKERNKQGPSIE